MSKSSQKKFHFANLFFRLCRNRYWGTPIPVWTSEDGEETVCVGSIDELARLSGVRVEDLHRETVDKLTIPSARPGAPPLRRISEVFDCWFESGSMPYAQAHYPFENKKEFEETFPADFIAEGTDQTRGWFYTLLVLSTALFDKPPFKNLIVNGLVLASDGQKMSKRKKNYPDPNELMNKYGADALRLFLINSPVVKAESLRFKEEGVKDILKDVFLPWYNAYRFLLQNVGTYQDRHGAVYSCSEEEASGRSRNVMDRWIVSFTQSLLVFVKREMAAYRLYTVLPRLMKFIDNLTNWYVRTNRKRLKGEGNSREDCLAALDTLFSVLFTMVRVFAPFTPFLTELMYQRLRKLAVGYADKADAASVHFVMIPSPRLDLVDEDIERSVARMQAVVELGRVVRDRRTMPTKYPLPELVVIHKDRQCLDDVASLQDYVLDELNIKKLTLSTDKEQYGVSLRAEPDHKTLGLRLKGAFKDVTKEIKAMNDAQVTEFLAKGSVTLLGHELGPGDLRIMYSFSGGAELSSKYEAHSDNDILVLLDCTPDQSMLDEGVSREVINRVQKLRKKAGLVPSDQVTVYYSLSGTGADDLRRVIGDFQENVESTTKSPIRPMGGDGAKGLAEETFDMKGPKMHLKIVKGFCSDFAGASSTPNQKQQSALNGEASPVFSTQGEPNCSYVNVVCGERAGVVLLENPVGSNRVDGLERLRHVVAGLFDLNIASELKLYVDESLKTEVKDVKSLGGKTMFVGENRGATLAGGRGSCCKFVDLELKGGKKACILLENPAGIPAAAAEGLECEVLAAVSGCCGMAAATEDKCKVFEDKARKKRVTLSQLKHLAGKTLYM